jgi:hypothetical protein
MRDVLVRADVPVQSDVRSRRDLRLLPCDARLQHSRREIDGTDVAGLNAVVIIDTPKVMTDSNWRLGTFIDQRANDEQADKLAKVFGGQLGGPMAAWFRW